MNKKVSIFWFRRDLRLDDNVGLLAALKQDHPVLPIFIFDRNILDELPKDDPRVSFIHHALQEMCTQLESRHGSGIALYYGDPEAVWQDILNTYDVQAVHTNRDYEPYAKTRDAVMETMLSNRQIPFHTYKDQVIFEKNEVVKNDGNPYVVYTPYKNKWLEQFKNNTLNTNNTKPFLKNMLQSNPFPTVTLQEMGFGKASIQIPMYKVTATLIEEYETKRDFPALPATSRLGPHLRFGTVSIRTMVHKAIAQENKVFLCELIWREFFMQILYHFPHTATRSFRPKYDAIKWRNNEAEFELWKKGETGYPLVDAGMRELNSTGFMHNRVRMLVASFLCKHLLIDWRWGEAYFAKKLVDYDMSANVGNWQWAAGSGVDAAPYFRIFNPTTQIQKFDKKHEYLKKWVPNYQELTYPPPMVDHKQARERCLKTYKEAVA